MHSSKPLSPSGWHWEFQLDMLVEIPASQIKPQLDQMGARARIASNLWEPFPIRAANIISASNCNTACYVFTDIYAHTISGGTLNH